MIFIHFAAIGLAIVGFAIAYTIYHHKQVAKKPLVCPMRSSCNLVTESSHSKLFGIHLENLGMAYYLVAAALHLVILLNPGPYARVLSLSASILAIIAFLFSSYLTYVQAKVIKEWCAWCLGSALISTLIFLLALYSFLAG